MLFLAIIFVVLMVFALFGYGYYGQNPGWAQGPYVNIFIWICVAILGWVAFKQSF